MGRRKKPMGTVESTVEADEKSLGKRQCLLRPFADEFSTCYEAEKTMHNNNRDVQAVIPAMRWTKKSATTLKSVAWFVYIVSSDDFN